jgi:hypothetical protein
MAPRRRRLPRRADRRASRPFAPWLLPGMLTVQRARVQAAPARPPSLQSTHRPRCRRLVLPSPRLPRPGSHQIVSTKYFHTTGWAPLTPARSLSLNLKVTLHNPTEPCSHNRTLIRPPQGALSLWLKLRLRNRCNTPSLPVVQHRP